MSETAVNSDSLPRKFSWFWHRASWIALAVFLCLVCPLSWIGWRFYVGRNVMVYSLNRSDMRHFRTTNFFPTWLKMRVGDQILLPLESITEYTVVRQDGQNDELSYLWWQPKLTQLSIVGKTNSETWTLVADCCPNLERLFIGMSELSQGDFRQLARLTRLREMQLRSVAFENDGLEWLAHLPRLKVLAVWPDRQARADSRLPYDHVRSPAAFRAVAHLDQIETLQFRGDFTDSDLSALCELRPDGKPPLASVKELSLEGSMVTGTTLKKLANVPNLRKLVLPSSQVSDEMVESLGEGFLSRCRVVR